MIHSVAQSFPCLLPRPFTSSSAWNVNVRNVNSAFEELIQSPEYRVEKQINDVFLEFTLTIRNGGPLIGKQNNVHISIVTARQESKHISHSLLDKIPAKSRASGFTGLF